MGVGGVAADDMWMRVGKGWWQGPVAAAVQGPLSGPWALGWPWVVHGWAVRHGVDRGGCPHNRKLHNHGPRACARGIHHRHLAIMQHFGKHYTLLCIQRLSLQGL